MNPQPVVAPAVPTLPVGDPSLILWVFFWVGMLFTLLLGFGLLYHWLRYGYMYPFVFVMMPIYLVGAVVLIGAMLAGVAAI